MDWSLLILIAVIVILGIFCFKTSFRFFSPKVNSDAQLIQVTRIASDSGDNNTRSEHRAQMRDILVEMNRQQAQRTKQV